MPLSGKKVLVAEDNFVVAQSLRHTIEDAGGAVVVAATAKAADQLSKGVDFVVLDVHLADGDACWLAKSLRRRGVPFVVLTGYAHEFLPPDLRAAPFVGKPCSEVQLVDAARRICA